MRQLITALCLALAFASSALAQSVDEVNATIDSQLGDHKKYQAVIEALQKGVADHDAAAVAALVEYPIKVRVGSEREIADEAAFVVAYDSIMTEPIAKVVTEQKYEDLFVNYQGIMFGSGEVWINGICKDDACTAFDAKVITIQTTDD